MYIHNIDLHYHAGQERAEGFSLADHLIHARLTGRKILGLTDHLGRYLNPKREGSHYHASVGGLLQYRAEMDALKTDFNDLTFFTSLLRRLDRDSPLPRQAARSDQTQAIPDPARVRQRPSLIDDEKTREIRVRGSF